MLFSLFVKFVFIAKHSFRVANGPSDTVCQAKLATATGVKSLLCLTPRLPTHLHPPPDDVPCIDHLPNPPPSIPYSTAVMDFLAQPPPAPRASPDAMPATNEKDARNESVHGSADRQSWQGSDGDSVSDDSEDERGRGRGRGAEHGDGAGGSFVAGKGADAVDPSSAGEAVAVAALATDYGQWLKRLAVKLRRATPAGQRHVRLRVIGPAVTGEQVRDCTRV